MVKMFRSCTLWLHYKYIPSHSRPPPWIPLPCRLPQPSPHQPQSHTAARATVSGPASVRRCPPGARWASASSWTAATAARLVPGRWARSATRQTRATTTRDCTATTVRTSLGTKKECVHVSVTHWTKHQIFTHTGKCCFSVWDAAEQTRTKRVDLSIYLLITTAWHCLSLLSCQGVL